MGPQKEYYVLAFYLFTRIEDPAMEVKKHHEFFNERDIRSRIYISRDGINAQMSAERSHAEEYIAWLKGDDRFRSVDIKIHQSREHVFPKATVKVKEQLVALDCNADPKEGGVHVPASEWKKMLEERDEKTIVLDVRNDYEWVIGHFEGALKPQLDTFRKFPEYARMLKEEYDPKETKVMMYCTGGIRCELYSALLKNEGFENVFQLDGGVIKYGLEEGSDYWKGKLFVFDDRLAVPVSENDPAEVISACRFCGTPSDVYYNCANMDCNELFLCCSECAEKYKGCCKTECEDAPRLRPFQKGEERPKPFRKRYVYESSKTG